MKCPIDGTELKITDRQGIEIDYCPQCRGVWLDRGELDKIIERSGAVTAPPPQQSYPSAPSREGYHRYDDDYYEDKPKRKRKSFLDDLFDF